MIAPSTLKGDDIELYDLWKKYAPRNQSFDDFKEMGSSQEIRDMSKYWTSWEDIEELSILETKGRAIVDEMNKFVFDDPDMFSDYRRMSSL